MPDFIDKLSLKGMADEDIYFAKRDRELIDALYKKKLHKAVHCDKDNDKKKTRRYEKRFDKITDKHKRNPKRFVRACRNLVEEIVDRCSSRKKK